MNKSKLALQVLAETPVTNFYLQCGPFKAILNIQQFLVQKLRLAQQYCLR